MGLYDALNPERAILYLDMKDSYDEIYGDNLLTDPNNSSLWSTNNATLSSVTGPTGGQAIRISYAGSGGNPYIYRAIGSVSASKKYRIGGWIKDDNVAGHIPSMFFSSTYGWTATSISGSWYQMPTFDVTGVASFSPQFKTNGTSGAYSDWADCFMYELRRVCKNQGNLGPATVQLGDGFTRTSFPTLLKKGMSFDGGDYIDCGQAGASLIDNFTMYCCAHPSFAGNYKFIARNTAALVRQWDWQIVTGSMQQMLSQSGSVNASLTSPIQRTRSVYAITTSGGFASFFNNGIPDGIPVAQTYAAVPAVSTLIGSRTPTPIGAMVGSIYSVAIFPEAHSEAQIKEMTRRMMQNKFIR